MAIQEQPLATRRRIGVHADHEHYKWWALSVTSLGMLLATINSGTLIIALPDLERSLHTSLLQLVWVILAYMIASTVLVLTAGRLSDLFGRKRSYVLGFAAFTLASLGAGFPADGTQLILWRILQGIGGGGISWHWVFWFNIPIGLAGTFWAWSVLHETERRESVPSLDLLGTGLYVAGLTGLVLGVSRGGISGWNDAVTIVSLVAAVLLLPLFFLVERRARAPMLDLTIFENRLFSAASAAAFINGLSRFALLFVFVFYFQGAQGDDPITAGLKLAPMAIGMLISSPLAGIWADRHGSRALAALGMLV